jgi:Ni,Fe-hydrogenase maturation factor
MPLFPQLGPEYYDEQDRGILDRMMAFYAESISINQSFWTEADTDTRFLTGDQTVWNDIYSNLPANRRKSFSFNRIRRVVEMISGHQRRNRKTNVVIPIENADDATADQYTKILMWCNQQEGVLETVSDAFHGSLATGMNLLQVWLDFRSDPISGNIKVDNCSYNSFLIDPFFRKQDLSDCNAIWKRSFLTKGECASLLPDKVDEIMQLMGNDNRDGKFQFMPENYNYGMKNLLTYDEYYYRDYRKQKMLVDSQTGEVQEWRSQDEEALKMFLYREPTLTMIEQEIPTVRLAIVVQGKVMYDGPNPLGIDQYPFVPVFAYYTPEMPYFPGRVQGVVRGLRDAQYLYNRRKAIELDILESQINSGWKYKEDALVNPRDIFLSGQGRGLAVKTEAQMSDVEQIIPPQVPPSMIQLSEILAREVQEISGVNEELLGSAIDDKAGILSMLRQGAGLTTLQRLFDQLDRSQKLLGKVMMDVIQSNFTPGKIKKILQEEPAPQFYNKAFGKYDCAVEEGILTTTQKQMELAQLLQLREMGIPIPDSSIIESLTVQDKPKLLQAMEQEKQQQMQMQQAQQQMAEQEAQSRIQLAQARAQADQGLGAERYSRIEENQALAEERRAEAIKDHELGLLNLVKAMKELDGMDINHLAQLVTVAKTLKDASAVQEVEQRQVQKPAVQQVQPGMQ